MNWQERYEEKPVTKFEAGRYYRYIGHTRPEGWNYNGKMDIVLDNEPRKCLFGKTIYANFNGVPNGVHECDSWCWRDNIENWREVPHPELVVTQLN